MRDTWYGDNRDLVKWGVLFRLAAIFEARRVLQLAFYRPAEFGRLVIDGLEHDIPEEVIAHFRDLRKIGSLGSTVRVTVFNPVFHDRDTHLQSVLALLATFPEERCIVFLDPDTGLEPRAPSLNHVLDSEAGTIWREMKAGDVFAFYQHQTNRAGQPWIEPKRGQLAGALEIENKAVKVARGPTIANDVAFFYAQRA